MNKPSKSTTSKSSVSTSGSKDTSKTSSSTSKPNSRQAPTRSKSFYITLHLIIRHSIYF